MGFLDMTLGFIFSIVETVIGSFVSYFFPQVHSFETHIRENWRKYAKLALYVLAISCVIQMLFFICLGVAFFVHDQLSRGLNIHIATVDFDMAMVQGKGQTRVFYLYYSLLSPAVN